MLGLRHPSMKCKAALSTKAGQKTAPIPWACAKIFWTIASPLAQELIMCHRSQVKGSMWACSRLGVDASCALRE